MFNVLIEADAAKYKFVFVSSIESLAAFAASRNLECPYHFREMVKRRSLSFSTSSEFWVKWFSGSASMRFRLAGFAFSV